MNNLSYREAIDELINIKTELQSANPDIDELGKMVERAKELINFCKKKLKTTEEEMNQLFDDEKDLSQE